MSEEVKKQEVKKQKVKLVADRPGQIRGEVYSKQKKLVKKSSIWMKPGQLFDLEVPVVDGEPKIPRWAHIPSKEELKKIEAVALAEHKKAGDARAI